MNDQAAHPSGHTGNGNASGIDCDIAVVGCGPVGMTLAALLGRAGHRVLVLERYAELYNLPRAATFDGETMRTFARLGVAEELLPKLRVQPTYDWRNAEGELLIRNHFAETGRSGWAEWYMMYQPELENALDAVNRESRTVEIRRGSTVVRLTDDGDRVRLGVQGSDRPTTVTARYVVACDGGNSSVRDALEIEQEDYGFSEPWLVCDFRISHDVSPPPALQLSDPRRPTSIISLGPDHHRFSFMLDSPEDFDTERDPERVWARVKPYLAREHAELIRVATYTFRSLVAERWRVGRVLLAGDAAHQMPPFLGQGMCSGIRDAQNIAFKLGRVLRGRASERVLDTYQSEREPHVRAIIEKGVELGRLQTIRDAEQAAARDRQLLRRRISGDTPDSFRLPELRRGLLTTVSRTGRGTLSVQGIVDDGVTHGLLDEVVGGGFHLLLDAGLLDAGARSGTLSTDRRAGIRVVAFGDRPVDRHEATVVHDVEGTYRRWFAELGCRAVLVRPDFYVFGTASGIHDLDTLIDDLFGALDHPDPTHVPGYDNALHAE